MTRRPPRSTRTAPPFPYTTLCRSLKRVREDSGKLFGDIELLGPGDSEAETSGIGVNAFLWRASLDTVSFLPLSSAAPFGGVIISDRHAPPHSPDARFKAHVFIPGKPFRTAGLPVPLLRPIRSWWGE